MENTCLVVIPYFQRQSGVLQRALASVARQAGCPLPVRVLVVDDASPVPPEPELAAIAWPDGIQVEILRRPNGGPGAARNTGLDAAGADTLYVAFLDSDDEWSDDHLARAVAALNQGFDFYFANHYQLDQSVGAFERAGRIRPSEHPVVDCGHGDIHAYAGDLFDQTLRGNVIGTSTVAFRFRKLSDQRFHPEFRSAGEDYLFWMEVAVRGARAVFSSKVEAVYGKGVNVFAGSGWGTAHHLRRVHEEILFKKRIRQNFQLNQVQAAHVRAELRKLREAFVRALAHGLVRRQSQTIGVALRHLAADPVTFLTMPVTLIRLLLSRQDAATG